MVRQLLLYSHAMNEGVSGTFQSDQHSMRHHQVTGAGGGSGRGGVSPRLSSPAFCIGGAVGNDSK